MIAFETLTLAPIDRSLIDQDMLDGDELAWLNAYHARVRDEVRPLVDEATRPGSTRRPRRCRCNSRRATMRRTSLSRHAPRKRGIQYAAAHRCRFATRLRE